jgi:hypothetical protein
VQLLLDHFRATLKYSRMEIDRLEGAVAVSKAVAALAVTAFVVQSCLTRL